MPDPYPLTLPTSPPFNAMDWEGEAVIGAARSGFTLDEQIQEHQGDTLRVLCSLPVMEISDAEAWIAFQLRLRGRLGAFLLGDVARRTPRGTATGSPVADTAGSPTVNYSGSKYLYTKGWTAGVSNILKAGDWLQIGSGADAYLHKNLVDANSDGSGRAVLEVFPKLRSDVADSAAITVNSAQGCFRLARNTMPWSIGEAKLVGISFLAEEDRARG